MRIVRFWALVRLSASTKGICWNQDGWVACTPQYSWPPFVWFQQRFDIASGTADGAGDVARRRGSDGYFLAHQRLPPPVFNETQSFKLPPDYGDGVRQPKAGLGVLEPVQ